jgi:predicted DCC family thiol-disulfide oxidoreductase YuxK
MAGTGATLLYDRDCGLCRWSLGKVLAWDRRRALRPVALQDPEARELLSGMGEEERMASWHLVTNDGAVRSAGAAFAPLLRRLPGGRPLAWAAERLPGPTERGYRFVADHRSAFGSLVTSSARRRADRRIDSRLGRGSADVGAEGRAPWAG